MALLSLHEIPADDLAGLDSEAEPQVSPSSPEPATEGFGAEFALVLAGGASTPHASNLGSPYFGLDAADDSILTQIASEVMGEEADVVMLEPLIVRQRDGRKQYHARSRGKLLEPPPRRRRHATLFPEDEDVRAANRALASCGTVVAESGCASPLSVWDALPDRGLSDDDAGASRGGYESPTPCAQRWRCSLFDDEERGGPSGVGGTSSRFFSHGRKQHRSGWHMAGGRHQESPDASPLWKPEVFGLASDPLIRSLLPPDTPERAAARKRNRWAWNVVVEEEWPDASAPEPWQLTASYSDASSEPERSGLLELVD